MKYSIMAIAALSTLTACLGSKHEAKINLSFRKASTFTNVNTSSTAGATTSPFAENHCYFINLTREEQSVCSTGASDRVGELFGPVPKGGAINVKTNPGPIRLDLLAFENSGSCEGDFALEKLGPGKFKANLAGQSFDPIWLVSTKQFEATPGSQNVTMDVLGTSENEMGISLACDDSKKPQITSVSTANGNQVVITGNNLAETSRVSIKNLGTNFEIVSKTETSVTARVMDSASFILGATHDLLVSNAWGQATTSLSVQLSNGSVRPEHLDYSLDWPFPTPKVLSYVDGESNIGVSIPSGAISEMLDASDATYYGLATPHSFDNGGTCNYSSTASASGSAFIVFRIGDGTQN